MTCPTCKGTGYEPHAAPVPKAFRPGDTLVDALTGKELDVCETCNGSGITVSGVGKTWRTKQ